MSVDNALEHVDKEEVRYDVIEFGAFHEQTNDRRAVAAAIAFREQIILAAERDLPVIPPISGRMQKFIIVGTLSMGAVYGWRAANIGPLAGSSMSREGPA
jgi:hypothetical protein